MLLKYYTEKEPHAVYPMLYKPTLKNSKKIQCYKFEA